MSTLKAHQHKEQPSFFQEIEVKKNEVLFPTDYESVHNRIKAIDASKYGKTRNFITGAVTYLTLYF